MVYYIGGQAIAQNNHVSELNENVGQDLLFGECYEDLIDQALDKLN